MQLDAILSLKRLTITKIGKPTTCATQVIADVAITLVTLHIVPSREIAKPTASQHITNRPKHFQILYSKNI